MTSLKVGLAATVIALRARHPRRLRGRAASFFGRDTISFLVLIPIALPGIVTGIALSNTFTQVLGISLGLFTVIVAHATFCIVVVYNNVVARLRRVSTSFEEASADLGAHTWQTFWHITRPNMQTALVAGALLAFGLSFDEIIVTTFTLGAGAETLPIWIFSNLFRPNQVPIVNVVALLVVLISILPIYAAHRLSRDEGGAAAGRGGGRRAGRSRGDGDALGGGRESGPGRRRRELDQDPLGRGGGEAGMAEDDLQAEPVLERDQPAGDRLRVAAKLELAGVGAALEDPLIQHRLAVEEVQRSAAKAVLVPVIASSS